MLKCCGSFLPTRFPQLANVTTLAVTSTTTVLYSLAGTSVDYSKCKFNSSSDILDHFGSFWLYLEATGLRGLRGLLPKALLELPISAHRLRSPFRIATPLRESFQADHFLG